MNKKTMIGLTVILFSVFALANSAFAGFFNDGRWYMDSSWWEEITAWDPEGRGSLVDSDYKLNWITTPGWTDGYEAFRAYGSKWVFELNDDFEFNVGFHYNHTGTFDTDEGDIEMGLVSWEEGPEPSHVFYIDAENWVRMEGETAFTKNVYWSEMNTPGVETSSWWRRTDTDGMLYARYNASEDELQFQALEGSYPSWELVGGSEYYGLKNKMGLTQLGVYFGGWSEGAGLASGDAYLQNFVVHKGTVTPEPVGSILFAVGGVAVAFFRKKKSKV